MGVQTKRSGAAAGHQTAAIDGGGPGHDKDFWTTENRKYTDPHFRLLKCARLVNRLAGHTERVLLDVGCGPATLANFVRPSIHYFGIDIAIPAPAPNLRERDLRATPIEFAGLRFDLVVAQGVFEYLGTVQEQKFTEIHDLLDPAGHFVVTYVNFGHRRPYYYWPYNNVQSIEAFVTGLSRVFSVDRVLPTAHNWGHSEPRRPLVMAANRYFDLCVPFITPRLAVEYFVVCSRR